MRKVIYQEDVIYVDKGRGYGFFSFMFDVILTLISGGLWLIYIFVREMRRR